MTSPLLKLTLLFMKIGVLGFGGGLAILPLLYQSIENSGIMKGSEFASLVAIAQVTPGPVAINAATWVGYSGAGILGATVATLAFMIPPFIITIVAAHFLDVFNESLVVQSVLTGIRPVAVGLVAAAIFFVADNCLFNAPFTVANIAGMGWSFFNPIALGLFAVAIVLNGRFKINPIFIILGAGLVGAWLLA